jgi:hypothetical protein
MKAIRITSTSILSLLLGIAAPAYAQHEQQGEKQEHSQHQQDRQEHARPEQQHSRQQQHAQQQQGQDHNKQPHAQPRQAQDNQKPSAQRQYSDRGRQHQQHAQQQRGNEQPRHSQERQRVEQSAWQQHRSQHWDSDHRTWQQRGGYHGYRIPDHRFRGYFGPEHGFRVHGRPFLVVGGYPRFQYSGYWFSLVDPWPEYWASNWYDTDDVYVAYVDNGYYLFNRRHPNVGIAISISM